MNYKEINRIIDESGLKRSHVAKQLGWTDTKLHNRTSGATDWNCKDVVVFCNYFGINKTQRADIFLT